jgi:hypothetical protein
MATCIRWYKLLGIVTALLCGAPAVAHAQALQPLQQILRAHQAWTNPPASVEIVGTATRGTVSQPVRITATRQEEVSMEYGAKRLVATPSAYFSEDGTKFSREATPSGFAQLDVTGLFLIAQLAAKPVTIGRVEPATLQGIPGFRVRVRTDRTEVHYYQLTVRDEMDIYTTATGLLAGISRSFYETRPRFQFTMALTFSDYRDTGGVLLPYRIERFIKGAKVETIVVDRYNFDVPASSSLFAPRRGR